MDISGPYFLTIFEKNQNLIQNLVGGRGSNRNEILSSWCRIFQKKKISLVSPCGLAVLEILVVPSCQSHPCPPAPQMRWTMNDHMTVPLSSPPLTLGPCIPSIPGGPTGPIGPGSPLSPGGPDSPGNPCLPSCPGSPSEPGGPGGPGGPGSPGSPYTQQQSYTCLPTYTALCWIFSMLFSSQH